MMTDDRAPTQQKMVDDRVQTPGLFGTSLGKNTKAMAWARVPSNVVSGISKKMMDAYEPETQSVPLNAIFRAPETLASIGTQGFANMITPESLATQGTLKLAEKVAPAVNAVGRFVGSGAEKLSGLAYDRPGVLGRTVEDPWLPLRPGVEAANKTYGQLVDKTAVRPEIAMNLDKKDLVQKAFDAVKDGTITPDEAFIARKTMGQIKNTIPTDTFFTLRKAFADIAESKFAGADKARAIAEDAENLRNVAPLNKSGTTSIFKTGVGLAGVGAAHISPYAPLTVPAFSPAVQAAISSGIGIAKRGLVPLMENAEMTGTGLSSYFNRNNQ